MRKFIMGCLGVVVAVIAAQFALAEVNAGVFSDLSPCAKANCAPCDAAGDLSCKKESLWNYGGWMEAGIYANEYGQTNAYIPGGNGANNFFALSGNTNLLNNVRQTDFQVNQAWLFLEKKLAKHGFDVGGRVDFMYGTDGRYLQSAGLEYDSGHGRPWGTGDYEAAIAQAYLEVGNREFSVKAGKFITPLGQESIMSPNRFFYSLSYAFAATPVAQSGVMATWNASKNVSIYGGWVNGENRFFDTSEDNAAVAGITYKWNKHLTLGYGFMIGKDDKPALDVLGFSVPLPGVKRDYFYHVAQANLKWNRWDYKLAWTLRNDNYEAKNVNFGVNAGRYGINNELLYRINCHWAVGARAEWMHYIVLDSDAYEFTLGANWTPNSWLLIRPEVRYDGFSGGRLGLRPYDLMDGDGGSDKQLAGGVSAVVKF